MSALNVIAAARARAKAHRARVYESYADADEWLQPDKLQHALASCTITLACYGVSALICRTRSATRPIRLLLAVCVSTAAGIGKEIGDELNWWYGRGSIRDLIADVAGTIVGVGILAMILWCRSCKREYNLVPRAAPSLRGSVAKQHCSVPVATCAGEARHCSSV